MKKIEETTSDLRKVYELNINTLVEKHYPKVASLDESTRHLIIEQLIWVQGSSQFTPQGNVIYDATFEFNQHCHIETFRALTRIEQLLLLSDTDGNHYPQLVKDQAENSRLSPASYQQLKSMLQITSTEREALIRATLIASVPLSTPAKEYLQANHADKKYPYDSVQFSGFTMALCPEMYPAYRNTSEETQQLIHYCFPNDKRH